MEPESIIFGVAEQLNLAREYAILGNYESSINHYESIIKSLRLHDKTTNTDIEKWQLVFF